jgi:Zn-dependent protease
MLSVIALRLSMFILLVLSLSVHEWAHARAAWALGDDTAARQGRLTLNPLAHLDPIGSLLPLLGVPFGWAKPVPVNPSRFVRRVTLRGGMMITAAAGPASNFALALICYALLAAGFRVAPQVLFEAESLRLLLTQGILINVMLGVFNLLPLPPLDGSRIVDGVMPYRWREPWERFERYGPLGLLAVIFVLPWLGFEPLGWAIDLAHDWIATAYH